MSVKGDTNRKWVSDPDYRDNFDRIFRKQNTGDIDDGEPNTNEPTEATGVRHEPIKP